MGKTVCFARDLRFSKIILEGDALQVVQALKKPGRNWCRYGHIIEETREILQSLQTWRTTHVRREFNGAAHQFAKEALLRTGEHILIGEVSPCISDIISIER